MEDVFDTLINLIDAAVGEAKRAGCYMPAIATALRLKADELADQYPDDTNGGLSECTQKDPHHDS